MIKPSRVGHATFETPDVDKALAYYVEVNGLKLAGRESGRAYLTSKTGLLTLALEQGREENLKRISFEVSPKADFADLACPRIGREVFRETFLEHQGDAFTHDADCVHRIDHGVHLGIKQVSLEEFDHQKYQCG